MAIICKNDDSRLQNELNELPSKNPELFSVLVDISGFIEDQFKKDTIITMIFRTQAEQDEIYKDDPKYKVRKFVSPHQLWDAFDLRDSIFSQDEIKQIVDYLNGKYNATNDFAWTALDHKVGEGAWHFHVQFVRK